MTCKKSCVKSYKAQRKVIDSLSWFPCGSSILVQLEFRELVFVEEGKPENPEKNPRNKARANNKLKLHKLPSRNQTKATLVGAERSHHCANAAAFSALAKLSNQEKCRCNVSPLQVSASCPLVFADLKKLNKHLSSRSLT